MTATGVDLSTNDGLWAAPLEERGRWYRTLREEAPISFHPEPATERFEEGPGFWALARHADVLRASRSPELFCSGQGAVIRDLPPAYNEFFGSMLAMDDPRHARLRSLVSAGFTPGMMARIEADIRRAAVEIVAAADEGSGNFVDDIAARLPLRIICDMMGIPAESYDFVLQQTNIILDPGSNPVGVPRGRAVFEAGMALAGLMEELITRPGIRHGDSVTAALLQAEVDGQRLTTQEIQSFFVLLCAAGNETTRNAIAWGLLLLTNHPEQRRRLLDDFDAVATTAADEIVRYASPVNQFRRTVTADGVSLGEGAHRKVFAQGDKVVLLYGSANRDPSAFDDPERFDVTRDPNPHVGFGGPGPHYCLGAHLARREMVVLFEELFAAYPEITAVGEPERIMSNQIHGLRHLGYELR
ncbi:MAG: cytochrome P450 [Actinomycetota bacterium]